MPLSWLMFISTAFNRWRWLQKKSILAVMILPGTMTLTCALVPSFRDFFVTGFQPFTHYGVSTMQFRAGPLFKIHYLACLGFIFTSMALAIFIFFKEEGVKKRQILILFLSSVLAASIDFYCVLTGSQLRWLMLPSGTFLFSQVGILYTVFRHRLLNVAPLAMKRIFQNLPDPIVVVDDKDIVRTVNAAARRFFPFTKRPIGNRLSTTLPNLDLKEKEIFIKDQEGREFCFHLTIEDLDAKSEGSAGKILYFRQITLQKIVEARLNESLEFRARLLGMVAHDLTEYAENQATLSLALKESQMEPERKLQIDLLTSSALASQDLLNNLMSWARTQGSQFKPVSRPFEWITLIRESLENMKAQVGLKNIRVVLDFPSEPLIGYGDSNMMSCVFRNIFSNAIRATPVGKSIFVQLRQMGNQVECSIRDEGSGMSPEQLAVILESSKNFAFENLGGQRTGFGLKIVRHFIGFHDGDFRIKSQLGIGTEISFNLTLKVPGHDLSRISGPGLT